MTVKEPGSHARVHQTELELEYAAGALPEAYERLILDALAGDQQHFVRSDELRASWKIFTPLLRYVEAGGIRPEPYPFGSRGPQARAAPPAPPTSGWGDDLSISTFPSQQTSCAASTSLKSSIVCALLPRLISSCVTFSRDAAGRMCAAGGGPPARTRRPCHERH